jgi:hypothetical protein
MSKLAHQYWKDGNCVASIPWIKEQYDLSTWRESRFKPVTEFVGPSLRHVNLRDLWLDMDIEDLDAQPMIAIQQPNGISWTELVNDDDFELPKEDEKTTRNACSRYLRDRSGVTNQAKLDAQTNANIDGDTSTPQGESYEKWEIWITLPIKYKSKSKATWDEDAAEYRHRVEILGSPADPHIGVIKPNVAPCGLPLLIAQETEDDIGIYHMARSETVKEYCKQIQIAQNQLIDNRDRNNNRQFFYNLMETPDLEDVDFNRAHGIPTRGEPSKAHSEMDLKDMTGTNLAQIEYCEKKTREALHATDVVLGIAMGGRTSASEATQAHTAATAPILEAIRRFEDNIVIAFMFKFKAHVQAYMKVEDLVAVLGNVGMAIESYAADTLAGKFGIQAEGINRAIGKMERFQKAQMIYTITKEDPAFRPNSKQEELLKSADLDPDQFLVEPSTRQAAKAALFENERMLRYGEWDDVEEGDDHATHKPSHERALFEAETNPIMPAQNLQLMRRHIGEHDTFLNRAASSAAAPQLSAGLFGPPSATAEPTPGEQRGQDLSAGFGNAQAGSSIPLTA